MLSPFTLHSISAFLTVHWNVALLPSAADVFTGGFRISWSV